jgi:DNA-binding response OmpR family regulator
MTKILVVDENRGQAMHLANALEDAGYAVLLSFSARAALKIITKEINLVVIGRGIKKMPRQNFIQELREKLKTKNIPNIDSFSTWEELITRLNQELKPSPVKEGEKNE